MIRVSVVIPTLDEGETIEELLLALAPVRATGHELILVDGGSSDDTCERAIDHVDRLLRVEPGRAHQMNRGAAVATGDWLWFVHADSRMPAGAQAYLKAIVASRRDWGRFDVRLDAPDPVFRAIETGMNWRSRLSGIATGDQGIFVRRSVFESIRGFPEIPLMEDIALSRRLRRRERPACPRLRLVTAGRRWQRHGVVRTVLLMWGLRLAYFLGADPAWLARHYRPCASPTHAS
ncbi:MAG: glycosyltransferase [Gammaproteobacteria bacterium]|nr:MAG: glycosyltransferase [Gammaproteobacteria bacterium]